MTEIGKALPEDQITGHDSADVAPPTARVDAIAVGGQDLVAESATAAGLELKARSQWSYARSRFIRHRAAMAGLVGLIIIFAAGAFANWVAPYGYAQIDLTHLYAPPTLSGNHFFGTDELGRDFFSRTIYGIRTSEEVGLVVAIASSILGVIIGAIAGFYRGWIDNILMRITDLVLTLPALAILLTAAALWGSGNQWRIVIILALFFWTGIARIVRGVFLSLREKEYVEAAKAGGAGDFRIMFRHILPNTLGPVIVNATLAVAAAILTESALSFLGFGIKPPTPSLGVLISEGQQDPQKWWLTVLPGLVLVLIVVCVNFVGDGLRDALDPTQRRVRA
ncbi:MAG: ABC transporter permease [Actinobacteria bacterium]|nr:ABC transporter permease [Actinomycetota bacterium]MBV8562220.1 ABC transporter permease [Actinomycetota bacterium]